MSNDVALDGARAASVPGRPAANHARLVFALSVVVTVIVFALPAPWGPRIAYPLMLLSTLAHELGHGLTAIAVGGDFESMQMWADGSGVAAWRGGGGAFSQAAVAAGGLVGPALAAMACLILGSGPRGARVCLGALGLLLLVVTIVLVDNLFGRVFIGAIGLFAFAVALRAPGPLVQGTLVFAAVQLALSVYSRGDYLFTPTAETAAGPMPSDVAQIAEALLLPYWFWGGACAVFSVVALFAGMTAFLRATRTATA